MRQCSASIGRIRVFARLRPVSGTKVQQQQPQSFELGPENSNEIEMLEPPHKPGYGTKRFTFDHVFDHRATNDDVFRLACRCDRACAPPRKE